MTFTEALAKQQSVIADCHFRYCEYRDKLDYLMEQLKVTDPWDLSEFAKLNQGIGAAMMDVRVAWADWGIAIDALAHIPTSGGADTATMDEWQEAVVLMPPGYRVKGAWFYDAHGNRTNLPDARMSDRQIDILTGVIPVA